VVTTVAGAGRLGARAIGLAPWESEEVPAPDGRMLRITATPARHGPRPGTGDRVLRGAGRRARARGKPYGGPNFFTSDHVPLHFEGWADFSESRTDLERAFAAAGLSERLRLLIPGRTLELGEP
jgi:hypothetical protein